VLPQVPRAAAPGENGGSYVRALVPSNLSAGPQDRICALFARW
jgi:hypothetical protein